MKISQGGLRKIEDTPKIQRITTREKKMSASSILTNESYNPGALLDYLKTQKNLTTDAQLA